MLKKIKKIIVLIVKEFVSIPYVLFCFIVAHFFKKYFIVIQAWVKIQKGRIVHNNWGDDINVFLIEKITKKHVIVLPQTKIAMILPMKTYVLIGSSIEYAKKRHSIVYGSGLMNDKIKYPLPSKTSTILAVRGELTYKWLTNNKISCPKVYGDPALLLPKFYKPKDKKIYKISFIPHHLEFNINKDMINSFAGKGVHIINVCNYSKWEEIIDDICSSEFVISSSLHGVIVSEAYGVPNVWALSKGQVDGFDFKFYDFYSSIGKTGMSPIEINSSLEIDDLLNLKNHWKKTNINVDTLLSVFPFEIKTEVLNG